MKILAALLLLVGCSSGEPRPYVPGKARDYHPRCHHGVELRGGWGTLCHGPAADVSRCPL